MSETSDTRKALAEWITLVADEIDADDGGADKEELAFEAVDGSEWVIYYSKAAAVIEASDNTTTEAAYRDATDNDGYCVLQTHMAYYILRDMLLRELYERGIND